MLYHRELGLPRETSRFHGATFKTELSNHAKSACNDDRYGKIFPPVNVTVNVGEVVEVEAENGVISKILVRKHYRKNLDIVIAFIPQPSGIAFVKTFWLNEKNDKHKTLDKSRYVCLKK